MAFEEEEEKRKSETEALNERRQRAAQLRSSISQGKADLASEEWRDSQAFWCLSSFRAHVHVHVACINRIVISLAVERTNERTKRLLV